MNDRIFKYEYLTEEARKILDTGEGYRDDTLFPARPELSRSKTNPVDVAITEIINCGKYEICDFLIIHYQSLLSRADYRLLTEIVESTKTYGYPETQPGKVLQLRRIIHKLTASCNFCLWLCSSPEDIYLQYLTGYIPRADKLDPGFADSCPDYRVKISLTKDEYIKAYVSKIPLPKDTVPLCDLGKDGILLAFEKPPKS